MVCCSAHLVFISSECNHLKHRCLCSTLSLRPFPYYELMSNFHDIELHM